MRPGSALFTRNDRGCACEVGCPSQVADVGWTDIAVLPLEPQRMGVDRPEPFNGVGMVESRQADHVPAFSEPGLGSIFSQSGSHSKCW